MRYDTIPKLATWKQDSSALVARGQVAALRAAFSNPGRPPVAPPPQPAVRSPRLQGIDKLVGLYEQAWSPMARRNLIADLVRQIAALEAVEGHLSMAAAALKEVALRVHGSMNLARRYTHAILAGWAVGCNYNVRTGVTSPAGQNPDYFRYSADDTSDMTQKCGEMVTAIRNARNFIGAQGLADNAQTLKVFMAPEFFFRGANGAYSPDIVSKIVPLLLGQLGRGWDHWLFVFGTAVAAIEDQETFCETCAGASRITFERTVADRSKTAPKCSNDAGGPPHVIKIRTWGAEVQNVALVSHDGETHLVAKEYVSGIDYNANQVRVQPGTPQSRRLDAISPQGSEASRIRSVFDDERMGGCIMNIAGLSVALEVCLDHSFTMHKPGFGRAAERAFTTQLLLIPSYGMEIGNRRYCCEGGIVFNVDGRGNGESDVVVNDGGLTNPQKVHTAIPGARGTIELWGPYPLPV